MAADREIIRNIVRSTYDIQKLRIQNGNRVVANFRSKMGLDTADDADADKILESLRVEYERLTDVIAFETLTPSKVAKISFQENKTITNLAELILAEQYFGILKNETKLFKTLEIVLKEVPIYKDFLADIPGVGPQMAGILISEIDIHKAKYVSGIWKYAGLDVAIVGKYLNAKGEEKFIPAYEITKLAEESNGEEPLLAEGKFPITYESVGRSRKEACLDLKEYTNRDGELAIKKGITFNPWLKTKLIGVLGSVFLKQSKTLVDGKIMGAAKRREEAIARGFKQDTKSDKKPQEQIDEYLIKTGSVIVRQNGQYAQIYYDYKNRLNNNPKHADKTDAHKHNMAVRYMIKMFLIDYYKKARELEGLEVYPDYATAKLGYTHGQDPSVTR